MKQINNIEELVVGRVYYKEVNTENHLLLKLEKITDVYCVFTYCEGGLPKMFGEHRHVDLYNETMFPLYEIQAINEEEPKPEPTIYVIEKAYLDPLGGNGHQGVYWYQDHGYMKTEQEAKLFCMSKGIYTPKDCMSIIELRAQQIPKYRYKPIPFFRE